MKKKFAVSLVLTLLFSAMIGALIGPVAGAVSFAASLIPKPKGALMAVGGLQREVWLPSLQEQYEQKRDWMNKLTDLSVFVDDNQFLHFAEIGAYPAVYINRTSDVDNVEPTDTPSYVELDTYDSQNYQIRKIGLYGIPYPKIEAYTRQSAEIIRITEAKKAAWALAPDANGNSTTKKIVIATSGGVNESGYKSLIIDDIARLAKIMDQYKFPEPETGRHLVLPTNMWWELILNNDILKAQIQFQKNDGIIDPKIVSYYGINIYRYDADVTYDTAGTAKAAYGTAVANAVVPMAFAFCSAEAFMGSGKFSMFNKPIETNTTGRSYEFGFQHRFKAGLKRASYKYSAGIYYEIV